MFTTYAKFQKQLDYYDGQDGRQAYFDGGEGPCILLLHGVPTSSWLYRKLIPILIDGGYRVIAPDMLGYGSSDKPDGYEIYSDTKMAERIFALMEYLKIPSWSHVFHDGGGIWTWAMLQMDKSKVDSLFMLNTIVYQEGFNPPLKFEKGIIARLFSRLYSFSGLTQSISINPTFKNGIKAKNQVNKIMLEGYREPLKGNGHHALYYFFTQTCQRIKDYHELHRSLSIPTTIIWGEYDDMLEWKSIESQVKSNFGISDEDIHIIDAKHFIQEEQPELIGEIILERLREIGEIERDWRD
jgi:pimeloyl-ACP methyl ester carboxylesterase